MFSFFRNEFKDNLKRTCYSMNFNPISQPYSNIEFEYSFENDELIIKGPTHTFFNVDDYELIYNLNSEAIIFNGILLDRLQFNFVYKTMESVRNKLETRKRDEDEIRQNHEEIIQKFNTSVQLHSDNDSTYAGSKKHRKTSRNSDINADIAYGSSDSDSRSSSCSSRSSED